MKNILLVEPRSPDFNIFSLYKIPRLGLALLGTRAARAGYNVKIVYQESCPLQRRHILEADLVGFSITTSTAPEGYRLARMVRALDAWKDRPTIIVFGGVHATFEPEEALGEGDYVFRGEADPTFVEFLEALKRGERRPRLAGLSWKTEGGAHHEPLSGRPVDMDSLPSPDWSLFEGYRPRVGAVMTSRGCPHDCSFCSVTAMLGRGYRMRSLDLVMQDLGQIRNRSVFFYDDHFASNPERTKDLLRRIIAERGRTHRVKRFSAQVRAEVARDPELLKLMRRAGLRQLFIGFESVNPRSLELYNKHQNLKDIDEAVRAIHRQGIWIHGMFVFGSDADTPETFEETVRFCNRNKMETVQYLVLTPLPGTRHYRELKAQNRIISRQWGRFDAFNTVYLPARMTPYQLQHGMLAAMKRFYAPRRALPWLLRLQPWIAFLHLAGWVILRLWIWKNRGRLRLMREDARHVFQPERRGVRPAAGRSRLSAQAFRS
jgi:radical SAM superfamily enzyme YgiQ (UPF0313 family)